VKRKIITVNIQQKCTAASNIELTHRFLSDLLVCLWPWSLTF